MEQPKLNYSSQCQLLKPCLNIKAGANFDALLNMKKYISGSKGYFASKIVLTYCEKNCSSDRNTFWLSVSNLQIGEITITMCFTDHNSAHICFRDLLTLIHSNNFVNKRRIFQ